MRNHLSRRSAQLAESDISEVDLQGASPLPYGRVTRTIEVVTNSQEVGFGEVNLDVAVSRN